MRNIRRWFRPKRNLDDMRGQIAAINKALAVIEFTLDGVILTANENFLQAMGYSLAEVQGHHHSMFVDAKTRESAEYRDLWSKLGRGEYTVAQYKRIGKAGKEVWIQASYNPICDSHGKPFKVVKYATVITAEKMIVADYEGQIAAINKAQAVIEFELDGTVRTANENCLKMLGYSLDEIKGRHHSMFVDLEHRDSVDYRAFWAKLGRGDFDAGTFRRIGKEGKEIYIQASYNPIFDANGKPFKVVKYATDVTQLQVAVQQTQSVVKSAIDGDLRARIPMNEKDGEVATLCAGINILLEAAAVLIRKVKVASTAVQAGAVEIAKGNTDLSRRTEEQASSLEETAASMEKMTSSVKQTADNAGLASQLADAARQQAETGGSVVDAAVAAMGQINSSSKRIADIIGIIDEIAFQTNLLALNAAVEAARAGEQGLSFAIVASEVRNLAGRSATAAKQIKSLIQDSVGKVDEGSRLVDNSGKALGEIVKSVKRVSGVVSAIAQASKEQAGGIEEVNRAVIQMEETTQQNATLVEQAAATSQSIAHQAQALSDLIKRYTVSDSQAAVRAPASATSEPRLGGGSQSKIDSNPRRRS